MSQDSTKRDLGGIDYKFDDSPTRITAREVDDDDPSMIANHLAAFQRDMKAQHELVMAALARIEKRLDAKDLLDEDRDQRIETLETKRLRARK